MDNRELAKVIIVSRGGVAKSADFVAAGIRAVDVVNMCNCPVTSNEYATAITASPGKVLFLRSSFSQRLFRRGLCAQNQPSSTMDTVISHHVNGP